MPDLSRQARRLTLAWALLALWGPLAAGCSSPTSPTPPVWQPPATPAPVVTPLAIACPSSQSATASTSQPMAVSFAAPTTTGGVAPVTAACTPASGSLFAIGTTTVTCTATDAATTSATCSFTVTVAPPVPRVSQTRYLAFGDSMTAGEVSPSVAGAWSFNMRPILMPSASYPTQLLSLMRARYTAQAAELDVINSGVPGEWAEDGARRLPGVLSSLRPQVVFLLEGSNDLGALGTPGVQRASRAIDTMAKEARGRGARVFLATIPPSRGPGLQKLTAADIAALNALIRTTARGEGAVLVDIHAALSADVVRYIGADGIHPTEAGYQKMAETFMAAVREQLETR